MNTYFYRRFAPYGLAVGSTAIAFLLSLLLKPLLIHTVDLLFFIPITVSTLYGGIQPGLVSIFLSVVGINFLLTSLEPQPFTFHLKDLIRLGIFFLVALLIHLLNINLRESKREVEHLSQRLLQEKNQQLQMALAAAQMGMWYWDLETGRITWSPEHEQLFGLTPGSFDGRKETFDACLHPDDLPYVHQALETARLNASIYQCEYRIIWPNGSVHWIEGRGQYFYNAVGQAVRMLGTVMDISDRKHSQGEIERQIRRIQIISEISLKIRQSLQLETILKTTVTEVRQLLNADRVVIFRLWPDGSGTIVEEAVVPGYPAVLEQNLYDPCFKREYQEQYQKGRISAINDLEQADVEPCYAEFLKQFGVKANLVVSILLGDHLWGLLIAHQCSQPRQWTGFETELLQQIANQISIALAQAQLLEQAIRQSQELAHSNAELQQFAYIASHDLQEPLRMVTSYLQILERRYRGQLDSDADEFIHFAVDGANRMRTLIHELLKYSRVNTHGQPFERVNCEDILNDVLNNLKIIIEETGAIITHDPLPEVMGDPTQLLQLFQNLISNSIKFCRNHPPQLKISAIRRMKEIQRLREQNNPKPSHPIHAYPGDFSDKISPTPASQPLAPKKEWLFSIQDNGIGINSQYLERIFVAFQRLHSQKEYPGIGIGLALSKKIVERHGGRIWVESTLNQGSIFYFTLPETLTSDP